MYQALYRKWRPAMFEDVYGQPHITVTLRREVASGRVGHAYLFTGTRGTGKTTCAKILAKAVNCMSPRDGDPCNICENCRGIQDGSIFDVLEIDAASNNGVDNIRELREETVYTPAKAKKKVYIIDEVHMLSAGAFNALLKTLEEPPAHVIFILATTEAHKLPATILSRCQRFDFRRIAPADIVARLAGVAEKEGIQCDSDALALIARLSDGALRDALSILDQCAGQGGRVTSELVMRLAGCTDRMHLHRLSAAVAERDISGILELVAELYAGSKDMSLLCSELMEHYRNLMAVKLSRDPEGLLSISREECDGLRRIASSYTLEHLLFGIRLLADSLSRMSRYADKRAELELCLIRLSSPSLDDSAEALLSRIQRLEALAEGGGLAGAVHGGTRETAGDKREDAPPENSRKPESPEGASQAGRSRRASQKASLPEESLKEEQASLQEQVLSEPEPPVTASREGAGNEDAGAEKALSGAADEPVEASFLGGVIDRLREKRLPQLAGFLKHCSARLEGDVLRICCPDGVSSAFLGAQHNKELIEEAVRAVTGSGYRLFVSQKTDVPKTGEDKNGPPELEFDDGGAGVVEYV